MKKVLIVQTGFLGDAVLATAMLRGTYAARKPLYVGMLVRSQWSTLLQGHPALARVHALDKNRRGSTGDVIREVRREEYDVALLPHRSLRSAWIALRAGVPRRVGFRVADAPWLLTDRLPYGIGLHEVDRNATLLERIGIPSLERRPWLVPLRGEMPRVRGQYDRGRPLLVVAPGSVWGSKRWDERGFAAVIREARSQGWHAVLVGSSDDAEICRRVARMVPLSDHDVLAGALSLRELLAVIASADRVIANDSGPVHIAESVGIPTTAIFGPTVPEFGFGPRAARSAIVQGPALPCRPCDVHGGERCPLGHHICMASVSVDSVTSTLAL